VDDTRGILDPDAMLRLVRFERHEAGDALDGLVAWFWSVRWDLPEGSTHHQRVLNHPAGHISVGTIDDTGVPLEPAAGRVYPMLTGVGERRLSGHGWTVAARTTTGGTGVFIDRPVRAVVDEQIELVAAVPGIDASVVADVTAYESDPAAAADRLHTGLADVVAQRAEAQIREARFVAAIAEQIETDRTIVRTEELAGTAGVSVRSLQRLFDTHVGVSPSFVIRRWRLIEAAEAARTAFSDGTEWQGWADVAARLSYADQAHLARDFRRHLGTTPSAYIARNRDSSG
jgi:AraC-like DNA-binding protein